MWWVVSARRAGPGSAPSTRLRQSLSLSTSVKNGRCRAADSDCLAAVPLRRCAALFRWRPGLLQWDRLRSPRYQAFTESGRTSYAAIVQARSVLPIAKIFVKLPLTCPRRRRWSASFSLKSSALSSSAYKSSRSLIGRNLFGFRQEIVESRIISEGRLGQVRLLLDK